MSVVGGNADIDLTFRHVRKLPKADIRDEVIKQKAPDDAGASLIIFKYGPGKRLSIVSLTKKDL